MTDTPTDTDGDQQGRQERLDRYSMPKQREPDTDFAALRERILQRDWEQPAVGRLARDTDDELERRRRRKGKTR